MNTLFCITFSELINLGFEAPAGQMYSSSNDLAKLMMLIFQTEETMDPVNGQVSNLGAPRRL